MNVEENGDSATRGIRSLLDDAVSTLAAGSAKDEALAEYVEGRRVALIPRPPKLVSLGRVWRLGALLLGHDGRLYEAGQTIRVLEPGRPTYQSALAETRREYRAAAIRGKFTVGETVNFDITEIVLNGAELRASSGAVFVDGDTVKVRWNKTATDDTAITLSDYLADRVQLLVEPPAGA